MHCCLLVVDMQKGIFTLKQPVWEAKRLIENVVQAIDFAHGAGLQVLFSCHENNSFLKPGTDAHGIVSGVEPGPTDIVFSKKHPNVFLDTVLDDMLKTEGVQGLIVCGLISNGCVKDACLSAKQKGYEVVLLGDAHSTFYSSAEKVVESVNRDMEKAGVRILPVDQLPTLSAQQPD